MKKQKIDKLPIYDERQMMIGGRSSSIALAFVIIVLTAVGTYKAIVHETGGLEFIILLATLAVKLLFDKCLGNIEPPKGFYGRPLPTGSDKTARLARLKYYLFDSIITGLVFMALDLIVISSSTTNDDIELTKHLFPSLGKTETLVLTAAISFVTMLIISFIFEYIVGELSVKRYNKMLSSLDSEDDATE